ncbi:hypothetical protein GGX14DRAFT_388075 [Mycena pura]|uniref:Uncharacterized protein n=1 Tax=Mycena pura TaxID=153505 RepID=A0AAD6YJL3_9AGAR|nr:hypothetical protein GGX14DRAFT_388075 [Mycena pura]
MASLQESLDALLHRINDEFTTDNGGRAALFTALQATNHWPLVVVLQELNAPAEVLTEFLQLYIRNEVSRHKSHKGMANLSNWDVEGCILGLKLNLVSNFSADSEVQITDE